MSRLAKKPILFDSKVQATYKNRELNVKGKLGELNYQIPEGVDLEIKENQIEIVADLESSKVRMMAGTAGSTVNNMITGVSEGFTKVLELVGVGYRAQLEGQKLTLALGYSHPIEVVPPPGITFTVEKGGRDFKVDGIDKELVGQVAAKIRAVRKPEPYKGKGIRYAGEYVRMKAGKAGKATL